MKPYSIDLRERVLAALDRGMSRSDIVATFNISLASLKRWLAARHTTGNCRPQPSRGGPNPTFTPDHDAALRVQVATFPDATLAEHAEYGNAARGTTISRWTIGRAIRRLGLSRKKRP